MTQVGGGAARGVVAQAARAERAMTSKADSRIDRSFTRGAQAPKID